MGRRTVTSSLFGKPDDDGPVGAICSTVGCGRPCPRDKVICGFCAIERGRDAKAKPPAKFDGATYEPEKDRARLSALLDAVRECMADGAWRTLTEIHAAIGGQGSEAGISARLRDLRKERFGAHEVERRRRSAGLYEYRVVRKGAA